MEHSEQWYHTDADKVIEAFDSSHEGLSKTEAQKRLERDGPNRMPEPPKRSSFIRFMHHFHNIFIYVLLAAAFVTAMLNHIGDTLVILAVVIINALIGYLQEGKAEKALDAIRMMLAPKAVVLRKGRRESIDGEALVKGDVVLLEAGDKVPADLRLIKTHGLSIQEALLTGESLPVEKGIEPVAEHSSLGDRICMAYNGTTVASGTGYGLVTATGAETEIGRISGMLQNVQTLKTPLVEQIDSFAKRLTFFILGVAGVIMGYGLFVLSMPFDELFMVIVGLSVAAIPEGLPAVLTITLAVGVRVMANRNAIVRRLPAIETVGAVSVICSDKTGTLTRNEMMVSTVALESDTLHVKGEGYAPVGEVYDGNGNLADLSQKSLHILTSATVLCNDAELRNEEEWGVEGDPMEGALLTFACKIDFDIAECRATCYRTDIIPFDSKHKYMATLHHNHKTEVEAFIYIKGAPEKILSLCRYTLDRDGSRVEFDLESWVQRAEAIASKGERVLAIAYRDAALEQTVLHKDDLQEELVLLGLVGLIDPPRAEAIKAVQECHRANIDVKMITGDHALTAATIGKQIGLKHTKNVLTGTMIDELDDEALKEAVLQSDIFARTTPEHKMRLVMALQSHDMTVAMTGDGVNDAPALKRADIGIAMGQKGSEAAKEASELVLADDNFASIVAAVREGRTVYSNIKKVISWTLPTNAGEALVIIMALLFALPLPITPIQILWINMITAVTLGIALAFEPVDNNIMNHSPRKRHASLLSSKMLYQIIFAGLLFVCGVFGLYFYTMTHTQSLESARTMAMNALVIMEVTYLFYIRNMFNKEIGVETFRATKAVWIAVGIVLVAQILMTYAPFMQAVFKTEALDFVQILQIFAVGFLLFGVVEIEKQIRLRFFNKRS